MFLGTVCLALLASGVGARELPQADPDDALAVAYRNFEPRKNEQLLEVRSTFSKYPADSSVKYKYAGAKYFLGHGFTVANDVLRQCRQLDPDFHSCRQLWSDIKDIEAKYEQAKKNYNSKKFDAALLLIIERSTDPGLLKIAKDKMAEFFADNGIDASNVRSQLELDILRIPCRHYLGRLSGKTEDTELAKNVNKYCGRILEIDPDHADGLLGKFYMAYQNSDLDAASAAFKLAKEQLGEANQSIREAKKKLDTLERRSKQKDYYKILGVDRNADAGQIDSAFKKLSKIYHPDRTQGDEEKNKKYKDIREAYDLLKDPG